MFEKQILFADQYSDQPDLTFVTSLRNKYYTFKNSKFFKVCFIVLYWDCLTKN